VSRQTSGIATWLAGAQPAGLGIAKSNAGARTFEVRSSNYMQYSQQCGQTSSDGQETSCPAKTEL
jgi:hypothetical protein